MLMDCFLGVEANEYLKQTVCLDLRSADGGSSGGTGWRGGGAFNRPNKPPGRRRAAGTAVRKVLNVRYYDTQPV